MSQIALIIATVMDFPTLITGIGSYRTNKLYKVLLWALIATLCGELLNALVRPAYEPSIITAYRLIGQIMVGLCAYGIAKIVEGRKEPMNTNNDETEAKGAKPGGMGIDRFFSDMARLLSFKLPWSERTALEKAYTAMFVIMLVGLFPMPYAFYDSLRVIVCICLYFFFQVIFPRREEHGRWFAIIIVLFVLYNPIIPIRFGVQPIWAILNLLTLVILFKARLIFDATKEDGLE